MTATLMYNEIQSQRGQQSILVFLWRLTSENVNAYKQWKMPRTTLVIRAAELGKCVAQTVISDVELHWGAAIIFLFLVQTRICTDIG